MAAPPIAIPPTYRGTVACLLLWNTWDQVDAARELIAQPGLFGESDLKGRPSG